MQKGRFAPATVVLGAVVLGIVSMLGACSTDDGVSPEELAEIVREEVSRIEATSPSNTAAPSKLEPSEFTKFVVDEAIRRYQTQGLRATVAHYNSPTSINGQWYVFIIEADGDIIAHFDATRLGHNLTGWIGTDVSGYQFGSEMLSATETGKWLTYVYRNPEMGNITSGDFGDSELKNVWVVRHDGLLFASGWYISVEDFIQTLVADMMDTFDPSAVSSGGIESIIGPDVAASGLSSTFEYYNNTQGRGQSLAFVADSEGRVVSAILNPELNATNVIDILGPAVMDATADGVWITEADNEPDTGPTSMRVWVVHSDGHYFGAGWRATPGN